MKKRNIKNIIEKKYEGKIVREELFKCGLEHELNKITKGIRTNFYDNINFCLDTTGINLLTLAKDFYEYYNIYEVAELIDKALHKSIYLGR